MGSSRKGEGHATLRHPGAAVVSESKMDARALPGSSARRTMARLPTEALGARLFPAQGVVEDVGQVERLVDQRHHLGARPLGEKVTLLGDQGQTELPHAQAVLLGEALGVGDLLHLRVHEPREVTLKRLPDPGVERLVG